MLCNYTTSLAMLVPSFQPGLVIRYGTCCVGHSKVVLNLVCITWTAPEFYMARLK